MFDWLNCAIKSSTEILAKYGFDVGFFFDRPTTLASIYVAENTLGVALPYSYKNFLLFSNGAYLFFDRSESDEIDKGNVDITTGLIIESIERVVALTQKYKEIFYDENHPSSWPDGIVVIAEDAITGDCFCLSLETNAENSEVSVLYGEDCILPDEWVDRIIAASFEEWLKFMFNSVIEEKQTPYYWFPFGESSINSFKDASQSALALKLRLEADKTDNVLINDSITSSSEAISEVRIVIDENGNLMNWE